MPLAKPISKPLAGEPPHQFASEDAFVVALRAKNATAATALFHRYAPYVRSLLVRVLGAGVDVPDLVHDVFVEALSSLGELRDPSALKGWLTRMTVFVARRHLRAKRRRWWLVFAPADELPDVPYAPAHDESEAVRATYAALAKLGEDERIAFTLRVLEELPLGEVAAACGVSLATIKRRVARAEDRFARLCRADPVLRAWIGEEAP